MDGRNPSEANPWFVCLQDRPRARMRLFLFPYAGGGPAAFRQWHLQFPESVELWVAHYPGRGARFGEPAVDSIGTLTEGLSQAITGLLTGPFAFFGHSLGGLLAYELARTLQQSTRPVPDILFVSGCGAPHLPSPHPPIHEKSDDELVEALREMNGIPDEVVAHSELMHLLLPTLRADLRSFETYRYTQMGSPLRCPIVAFGGRQDPRLDRERLEAWALHTVTAFQSHYYPGDHFFLHSAREALIEVMVASLLSNHAKH